MTGQILSPVMTGPISGPWTA